MGGRRGVAGFGLSSADSGTRSWAGTETAERAESSAFPGARQYLRRYGLLRHGPARSQSGVGRPTVDRQGCRGTDRTAGN